MELPIALQTALNDSEEKFQQLLRSMNLTRDDLTQLADKIREKQTVRTPAAEKPITPTKRRITYV
jgi:hypothetical protein